MLKFLTDENFNGDIFRGVCRRNPVMDIVRVQDVGLSAAADPTILDYNYRPNRTDNFTFSIQRQIANKLTIEAGYMGRISHNETSELNVDGFHLESADLTIVGTSFTNETTGRIEGTGTLNVSGTTFRNNGFLSPGLSRKPGNRPG